MAGIYGNSAEDRYFEAMLHKYLEETEQIEEEEEDACNEADLDFLETLAYDNYISGDPNTGLVVRVRK